MTAMASDWDEKSLTSWTEFGWTWHEPNTHAVAFWGWSEKEGHLGMWLAKAFSTSPLNHLSKSDDTWQEAGTQRPLPSLCFRADQKTRMAALLYLDIWEFSSATPERNSTKVDWKQELVAIYQSCVFSSRNFNKDRWWYSRELFKVLKVGHFVFYPLTKNHRWGLNTWDARLVHISNFICHVHCIMVYPY